MDEIGNPFPLDLTRNANSFPHVTRALRSVLASGTAHQLVWVTEDVGYTREGSLATGTQMSMHLKYPALLALRAVNASHIINFEQAN